MPIYGDRWKTIRPLGEGGQAHIFVVEDLKNQGSGIFVLKRLKNIARLNRFAQEIETIKRLKHSNILPLIDADLSSTRPYFVAPLVEGGSLAEHDDDYKDNPIKSLDLVAAVADGLAHAHHNHVVHRDIKPQNILLTGDGNPVIADFGICYVETGEGRITLVDEAVGGRLFVAPELEDGRADDVLPYSDIYSLGKVLYWLLAGGRVFSREQHREDAWNLVKRFSNSRYEHVNRLLDRMIVHEPEKRIRNGEMAAEDIRLVADLFRKGARAIAPGLKHECDFCKRGTYKEVELTNNIEVHNFGLASVGNAKWHALVCDLCGHLQIFRLERAAAAKLFWGR